MILLKYNLIEELPLILDNIDYSVFVKNDPMISEADDDKYHDESLIYT